jgi:hypothetical protein
MKTPVIIWIVLQLAVVNHGRRLDGKWGGYRLGDVVKGYCAAHRKGGWNAVDAHYHTQWPSSIAAEYLHRTHKRHQYDTLCDIVHERQPTDASLPPNEAVLHIRVGDVLHHAQSYWEHGSGGSWKYVKNRHYYERALAALPPNVRNITIVGWDHHGGNHMESERYRTLLQEFLETNGYHVKHRREHLPDDDFVFMAHAPFFIYGGGGFSRLVGECVHKLGGITPIQWEGMGNGEDWTQMKTKPMPEEMETKEQRTL